MPSRHDEYTAGTVLADRYRIVGLLGRGGMGEVYRADDLKLGVPVALKFLPRLFGDDPQRLGHFMGEVRTAREVSHPNVCRVYDVGDADGRHFLTMEFIDGEDLASLLRRIGRIPGDKGLEIARQLCAGLAAVHERGVLHRDLKPANVMVDGRGKARLTDFGVAAELEAEFAPDHVAGTPAYMAPEVLRGEPPTPRSDIYALGLVLYEVFSGRRAFEATSIADLREMHERMRPADLASSSAGVDPAVEEVIFRCLEIDPRRRPASAITVAAMLPGGDPLAAALAAGETPSPDVVAASGTHAGMRPAVAIASLAGFFVLVGDRDAPDSHARIQRVRAARISAGRPGEQGAGDAPQLRIRRGARRHRTGVRLGPQLLSVCRRVQARPGQVDASSNTVTSPASSSGTGRARYRSNPRRFSATIAAPAAA